VVDDHRSNDHHYDEHISSISTNKIYHHHTTLSTDDVSDSSHDISIQSNVLTTPVDHLMPVQMANGHDINGVFTTGSSSPTAIAFSNTISDHYNEDCDNGIMENGEVDSLDFPNVCTKLQSSPAIYLSARFCERPFLEHTSTLADILTASLASARSPISSVVTPKISVDESNTSLSYNNQDISNDEDCLASEPTVYPNRRHRRRSVVLEHLELLAREQMNNSGSHGHINRHLTDAMPASNRRRMSLSQDTAVLRPSAVMDLPTSFNAKRRLSLPMASLNSSTQELSLPLTTPWSILKESEKLSIVSEVACEPRPPPIMDATLPAAIMPLVSSSLEHTIGTTSSVTVSSTSTSAFTSDTSIDNNKQHLVQVHTCHDTLSINADSLPPPLTSRVNWQLDSVRPPKKSTIPRNPSKLRHCITADDLIRLAIEAENEQISDYESNGILPGQRMLSYGKDDTHLIGDLSSSSSRRRHNNNNDNYHHRYRTSRPHHLDWHPDSLPGCSELEENDDESTHWSNSNYSNYYNYNNNSSNNINLPNRSNNYHNGSFNQYSSGSHQDHNHEQVDVSATTDVSERTRRNRSRRHRRRRATIPPRRNTTLRDQLRHCQDVTPLLESADVPPLNLLEWQGLPPPVINQSSSSMVPINRTEQEVLTAAIPTPPPWLRHLDEQVPLTALPSNSTAMNTSWSNTEEKKSMKEADLDQEIATNLYSTADHQHQQSTESFIDCGSGNISNDGSYDSQQGPECDWSTSTNSSVDSQESARSSSSNDSQQSRLSGFSWSSWRLSRDTTVNDNSEPANITTPFIASSPSIRFQHAHTQYSHGLADLLPSPYSAPSIASTTSSSPQSLLSSASNTLRKRPSLARITSSVIGMGKQLVNVFGGSSRQSSTPSISPSHSTHSSMLSSLNLPTTTATTTLSSIQHLPPKYVRQGEIAHSLKSRASTMSFSSKWHRLSSGDKMIRIDALKDKEDEEDEESQDVLVDLNKLPFMHHTKTTAHESSSTATNTMDMDGNFESTTYHSRSLPHRRGSAQILLPS
jgi:hypothetical protein